MRRVLFGVFWFGVLWLAITVAGGAITGAYAGSQATRPGENFREGYQRGYDAGAVAGAEFRQQYGMAVLAAAATLAALGTFSGVLPGTKVRR